MINKDEKVKCDLDASVVRIVSLLHRLFERGNPHDGLNFGSLNTFESDADISRLVPTAVMRLQTKIAQSEDRMNRREMYPYSAGCASNPRGTCLKSNWHIGLRVALTRV